MQQYLFRSNEIIVTQATKDATIVVARPRRRVGVDDNLRTATLFVSKQATSNEFVEVCSSIHLNFTWFWLSLNNVYILCRFCLMLRHVSVIHCLAMPTLNQLKAWKAF